MSEYGDIGAVIGLLIFALLIIIWVRVADWLAHHNNRTINRPYDWERDR